MSRTIRRLAACTLAIAALAPAHAQFTKKSLVIAVDGMRPDAIAPANAPNMDALIATGAYSLNAQCEDLTFSGPNHSTIIHGVHRDKHNVTTNDYSNNRLADWPDYLSLMEQVDPSWNTVRMFTWDASHFGQPTNADEALFRNYIANGDALATQDIVQIIRRLHPTITFDPDAIFVFLSDVDVVGHSFGFDPSVPQYRAEIANTDTQIGAMLDAIELRPNYANEDWQIIITSDHGGNIDGSHHGGQPEKRRIPFIVHSRTVAPGEMFPQPMNVDVAKTVLTHMGIAINPAWQLDGHAVGFTPTAPQTPRFANNLIFNADGEFDRGFADWSPDQHLSGWNDPGPNGMTVVAYDSPGGWPLSSEPGPADRGDNFFCAGSAGDATISQTIDLTPLVPSIDAGRADYRLAAYLGGYLSQNDQATLRVRFLSATGVVLRDVLIGPVTPAQRGNATGLLPRSATGVVPVGARSALVELRSLRFEGTSSDGYADNLELVLTRARCTADLNLDGFVGLTDLSMLLASFGSIGGQTYETGDLNGDDVVNLTDLSALLARFGQGCP